MVETDPLYLDPPTDEDLTAALQAWRDGRLLRKLRKRSHWFRILRARSAEEAGQFACVCYPSDANNRFSPIRKSGHIVPAAYAGDQPETVAWEVVLRDIRHKGVRRVPEHQTRDRYLVKMYLARSMSVLDIRRPQSENLVVEGKHSPNLSAAPAFLYNRTRLWAQRLLERIPEAEGILYESHQIPGGCLILFADSISPVFEPAAPPTSVSDPAILDWLRREAARVDAHLDLGDLAEFPDTQG